MANYNESDFYNELQTALGWSSEQIERVKNAALGIKIKAGRSWAQFLNELEAALTPVLPTGFKYPVIDPLAALKTVLSYRDAKTIDEIKQCLDAVRGKYTELRMESYFLTNQELPENENYLARIYSRYWNIKPTDGDKKVFLLLCTQFLLTKRFTCSMMNWIIDKHAKKVLGDTLSKAFDVTLNKRTPYAAMERSTLLKIAHALRIDDFTPEQNFERTEALMIALFGEEGYDPRSFLEMLYYYASVRSLPYPKLHNSILLTAKSVLRKLLPESISTNQIDQFVNNYDAAKGQTAETLLNLAGYSGQNGFLSKAAGTGRNWKHLTDHATEVLEKMRVRSEYSPDVDSDTWQFMQDNINEFVAKCSNPEDFVNMITADRHFYVTFFNHAYASVSQIKAAFSEPVDLAQQAAADIYWNNCWAELTFPSEIGKLNRDKWKESLKKENSRTARKELLINIFNDRVNYLRSLDAKKINQKKSKREAFKKAHSYVSGNVDALYNAILDEVERDLFQGAGREKYIFQLFQIAVDNGNSAVDFEMDIDVDSNINALRWKSFDEFDYHDIYLAMCLNTDDPMQTFETLNSTAGYEYY